MKPGFLKYGMLAAICAPVLILASSNAWAACPTSPYYSPDFSVNGTNCLALNGTAGILAPAGGPATITAYSASAGTVTFTAANSFVVGEPVILSGFANSTFLNTLVFPVTNANSTQFTVAYTPPSGSSDTGTATPLYMLQLTPNTSFQVGSAWDTTPQPVSNSFSTTFAFQLNSAGQAPGDGIAFVIQNSSLAAMAADGCSIGFAGDPDYNWCGTVTGGITNSVAVAFKTAYDGPDYPNQNSVSITSQRTGANCIDKVGCTLAENDLASGPTLADGKVHAVTIAYTLQPTASQTNCIGPGNVPVPCLDVILDGTDLFPTGVAFDMASIGLTTNNTAWVGFTGATGANTAANNILSWVFTPAGGSQTGNISTGSTKDFNSGGGFQQGNDTTSGYNFNAQLTSGNTVSAVVTTIPIANQAACNALVQSNPAFSSTECFVYQNGGGQGVDKPVMFELTCPPAGECDSGAGTFPATLGSDFAFVFGDNSPLTVNNFPPDSLSPVSETTGVTGLPGVGLLKGQGPDPIHPCTPYPNNTPPLFQSNQISNFIFNTDTSGGAHGSSGDTNSCWVVTYNTPGELPTVSITAPSGNYPVGGSLPAAFTCSAVNNSSVNNGVVGPYLTVPSGSCTGPSTFDTSTIGAHTYTATVTDSALNTNYETVTYYVQQAPVITSANTTYFSSNTLGSFQVTTTGYPKPTLTKGTGFPSWATFTDNGDGTATISGTPPTGSGGTYPFNITAANTVNPNYVQAFTLVVDQNLAITSANNTTFAGGVLGSFTVTAPGYPVASISQTGAPAWVTLTDNHNGTATLSGTPPLSLGATSFPITITAQNGVSPNATQSFTLNVSAGTMHVSVSTSPAGRTFTVDSVNYTAAASLTWTIGTPHTISVSTPQISGGTEYTFNNWSDTGAATHQVTATTSTTSYVASFNTLYQLTTAANPTNGGTVTPASGTYFASGSHVSLAATPNAGFKFSSWSGPVASTSSSSTTVTMSAPETVTANFSAAQSLLINPTSLNFANVNNNTSSTQTVTLTNQGSSTITISSVRIPGSNTEQDSAGDPDDFSFVNHCGSSLAAGKSCIISVTLSADNDYLTPYASMVITDSAPGSPQSVSLTSNILDPLISLSPNSLSFGSVTHGTSTTGKVTVKNSGLTALKLSGLSISATAFAFTNPAPANSCTSTTTLNPGATCIVGVTFTPAAARVNYSGLVTINSNALNGGTQKISLSGTGK